MTIDVTGSEGWNIKYDWNEAALRDVLAEWAHIHGWTVRREVVIPNWGRLDLLCTVPGFQAVAIELKLDLSQPAKARKAFQQADGYYKWLLSDLRESQVILAAPNIEHEHVLALDVLYADVDCKSTGELLGYLEYEPETLLHRADIVLERMGAAQDQVRNFRLALDAMAKMMPKEPVE